MRKARVVAAWHVIASSATAAALRAHANVQIAAVMATSRATVAIRQPVLLPVAKAAARAVAVNAVRPAAKQL